MMREKQFQNVVVVLDMVAKFCLLKQLLACALALFGHMYLEIISKKASRIWNNSLNTRQKTLPGCQGPSAFEKASLFGQLISTRSERCNLEKYLYPAICWRLYKVRVGITVGDRSYNMHEITIVVSYWNC